MLEILGQRNKFLPGVNNISSTGRLREQLEQGMWRLDLYVGIVSRVYGAVYSVVAIVSRGVRISEDEEYELAQTYCDGVVRERQAKHCKDVERITEMLIHPFFCIPSDVLISVRHCKWKGQSGDS